MIHSPKGGAFIMVGKFAGVNEEMRKAFLRHPNCMIINHQYGYMSKPKKKGERAVFVPCGSAVEVEKVLIELETMKRVLKVRVYDCKGNGTEVDIPRNMLTEQNILNLTEYGAQVDKQTASTLIKCIENEETDAPEAFQHKWLGFSLYDNEQIFKGYKGYGIASEYVGGLEIEPRGSMKEWEKMVKEEVLGTPLEVVLVGALSAVVLDYIHQDYPTDNILMSLVGNSSSGKTTALNLAVSAGARPFSSGKSFMMSFIDTELSIIHKISSAYPAGIDEFTAVNHKSMTKFLYSVANGSERSRMNKKMDIMETNEFHTSVFMSSECSILSSADDYEGLRARVMEFEGIQWTKSAQSADAIKKASLSNYGWAVPLMAQYLLNNERKSLVELCEKETASFLKNIEKENPLMIRMARKVGIILATANIAKKALKISFDIEMIKGFFYENLRLNKEDFDIGLKAYDAIIAYVIERPDEFGGTINNSKVPVTETYYKSGKFKKSKRVVLYDGTISEYAVFIKEYTFNGILEKKGIRDSKVILHRLRELGLLVSEKDRLKSKECLGLDDTFVSGYTVRIKKGDKESDDSITDTNAKKKGR